MGVDALFTIVEKKFNEETNTIEAQVRMDKEHDIFKGHFPQQPILPGVCQLHLVKSLLEAHVDRILFLKESSNIKFLNMIDPLQSDTFDMNIKLIANEEAHIKINANINNVNGICLKFKGTYLNK